MREIKFRAWIFGSLDSYAKPFMEEVAAIVWDIKGPCIKWTRWEEISCPGEYILMQYTGLKDKNGKEIYKGDIVKNLDGDVALVQWDEDVVGFALYWIEDDGLVFGTWGSKDGPYLEVIGNFYENPELLERP
jgi:uncharacterized phage protein (TIGR01671 family)